MKRALRLCALWLLSVVAFSPQLARAQTGVSNDRVSLPEGPGSLEGVGENVDVNANMGSMSWNIPLEAPAGFVAPSLALSYSSGGGGGIVGMGWSMEAPCIERMTWRGLPEYDRDDDFGYMGQQQLVRLPGTEPPVYRSRYEGGFLRFTWLGAAEGAEGYWLVEGPDGSKGYYGATAEGALVPEARVSGAEGTFRYHLVEQVDVFGHVARYEYRKDGVVSLLQRVGWNDLGAGTPRYSMTFRYEDRADLTGEEFLSDAKAGFNELLRQRLATVSVFSGSERIRRYELRYEPYADSGGFTRLASVERFGLGDERYPVAFTFGYSQALGGVCDQDQCDQPFMVDMGSVGVDLSAGRATLIDINGDTLPDMLSTPPGQRHRFFLNAPQGEGASGFEATPRDSALGDSGFQLGTPYVHVLDVNGDGFTDLLNAQTGQYLQNDGGGDWARLAQVTDMSDLPDFQSDFDLGSEGQLRTIRFLDYDGDKRIDLLRANAVGTTMFRNLGAQGFAQEPEVDALGVGFDTDTLQLTDMNGDGLLDLVQLFVGRLRYRLNLGRGRWAGWQEITGLPITQDNLGQVELEDLNGDALSDLVIVSGSAVQYAINRNGARFFALAELTSAQVEGDIPARLDTTTVLYADMNGNGSTDVVWADSSGRVRYLELFPVRPNLLSRIENGLGMVTQVRYATSVSQMARDGGLGAWEHALPHPMLVVEEVDTWDRLTELHEVNRYRYRDGYYNGVERLFRGYAQVEVALVGDESQEEGLTRKRFDVGAQDNYRHGLLLEEEVYSGARRLEVRRNQYEDCEVAQVPGGAEFPVRYLCMVGAAVVMQEGLDEDAWIETREEMAYDGYGNVTLERKHGVTSQGGGACGACDRDAEIFGAPCGPQCLGDERVMETSYIWPGEATGGRWILRAPYQATSYGRAESALKTETRTYYDGDAFEGLPLGRLELGLMTRVTERISPDSDDVIQVHRFAHDEHGNVTEELDPLGEPGGATHRRSFAYDEERLRVVRTDIHLEDAQGAPYLLRQEVRYEELFDKPVESTAWMRVVNGQVQSARRPSFYSYDAFGRIVATVKPGGDTLESPSEVYRYELGDPVSRIVIQQRSQVGGPLDLEQVRCIDGRGRMVQERTRISEGRYQVAGLTRFNVRSQPVEMAQPYMSASGGCDASAPPGVRSQRYRYDSTGRPLQVTSPDGGIYGEASFILNEYQPLATIHHDAEDNDPASPHAETPMVERYNGLGDVVEIRRRLANGEEAVTRLRYDALGRMRGYVDAAGNEKVQEYDLLGRVVRVLDPNTAGESTWRYDAASNEVAMTDDRGITTRMDYDGMNREVARWDEAAREATLIRRHYDLAPDCDQAECSHAEGMLAQVDYPLEGLRGGQGRDQWGFDLRGRPIFSARTLEQLRLETRQSYDNANRQVMSTQPDGRVLRFTYDGSARLTSVEGVFDEISYTDQSLLGEVQDADGTRSRLGYDELLRVSEAEVLGPAGELLQGFGYRRDRVGNLVEIEDRVGEGPDYGASFGYDAWYRVTRARLGGEEVTTRFDAIDNLTEQVSSLGAQSAAHVGQYQYERPNAASAAGALRFGYDAAGYMTTRDAQALSWDWQGRMTRVEVDGVEINRNYYGASNERVVKVEGAAWTHYVSEDFELRDGIASVYLRLGGQRAARLESSALAPALLGDAAPLGAPDGEVNAGDAWVSWASEAGLLEEAVVDPTEARRLLRAAARRLLVEAGPEVTFLHRDHLGSITMATGGDGEVLGRRAWRSFGQARAQEGYVDDYGFTGQELDQASGLLRFGWRYLDPRSGRWISMDPAFSTVSASQMADLGESTTAYAYVANNPINAVDPSGLGIQKFIGKLFGRGGDASGAANAPPQNKLEQILQLRKAQSAPLTSKEKKAQSKILSQKRSREKIYSNLRNKVSKLDSSSPSYHDDIDKIIQSASSDIAKTYTKQAEIVKKLNPTVKKDKLNISSQGAYEAQARHSSDPGFVRQRAGIDLRPVEIRYLESATTSAPNSHYAHTPALNNARPPNRRAVDYESFHSDSGAIYNNNNNNYNN